MISTQYTKFNEWFNARNNRERMLILITGWMVIYMFWFLLVSRPLLHQETALKSSIVSTNIKIKSIQEQANTIVSIATEYSTNEQLQIQKMLFSQTEHLKKTIEVSAHSVSAEKNIEQVLKDILSQPNKGVVIVDLRALSMEPLIKSTEDTSQLPPILKHIYKQGIQIQLQSDYYNTMTYLNELESLKWRLYWDSIDYRVSNYPKADVNIKLFVLVNQVS